MNIVEKILCRVSGSRRVEPGEFIKAKVDKVMFHDLTGPLVVKVFRRIGVSRVWNPDRVIVIFDHLVPANTERAALNQKIIREFVREQGIRAFYDVGRGGICHQIMVEMGHAQPGELIVGADSHTCTYGAVGAFSTGMGATDVAAILATGETWIRVPETLRVLVNGKFDDGISAKDVILHIIGRLGVSAAIYKAVVFHGSTVSSMSVAGRMTLCNMAVEMGAGAGIVEPDEITRGYFRSRGLNYQSGFISDPDAEFDETVEFEVSDLEPQVSLPNSIDNVKPVSEVEGVPIDQAYIGSCTNGRLEDLRVAARIAGKGRVKPGVRAIVVPASQRIYMDALKEGLIEVFLKAGVLICSSTCGACIGAHMGVLAEGETCIASINRNFVGRMGSSKSKVYLASPATVMASALEGCITDPRRFLS